MMKKFFLILSAFLFMAACNNQTNQQTENEVQVHTIEELAHDPMSFEDQTVRFEGVIGHLCQHSGDKMRVVQLDNEAFSMQVMLGDLMNNFSIEHEGSVVEVTGTLKTVVRNLDALEEAEAHDHDHDHAEDHDHEEDHDCESTAEAIRRMAEKGIDPDIRPYVELTAFKIK
jgi:hypothetical protein